MSRFLKAFALSAAAAALAAPAMADSMGLGRAATAAEIAAWDIDIRPDGLGLPVGGGDVATGEELFADLCASCHGDFGEGVDRWPVLAGGLGTLDTDDPVKTVGSYWPYLSTVYDYVHRAMPFGDAQSLTDDEVYAITAYILYANDLVDDDFELTHENFAEVRLPNEKNFFMDDRAESPLFGPREVCMTDCKETVEIVMRARILDVTPETEGDEGAADDAGAAADEASLGGGAAVVAAAATAAVEAAAAPAGAAFDAALAAEGDAVFQKSCKRCHQVGDGAKNRTGPILTGVYGAPVGAVEGFRYSKAFGEKAGDGVVWTAEELDAFLTKPRDWAKRTKMAFAGLRDEGDRAALIEYLKSVSE